MAAKRSYSTWALAAIAGGVVLTGIEVVGAVGYLVSQNQPSYLVAGGAAVTVLAAVLLPLAERCWRRGRYLMAVFLVIMLVPALSVIFTAAVERTGGASDDADRDRQVVALKIRLAGDAVNDAKAVADSDEAAAKAECSRAPVKGADPRGVRCIAAEKRADNSRRRLKAARDDLAQAGITQRDPMVARLAAVLPVSEEAIALYQPLVLPLAISALGLLLIAVGAHSPKRRPVPVRRGKRKKRRALPLKPSERRGNVVPLRKKT